MPKIKGWILIAILLALFVWWGSAKSELYIDAGPAQVTAELTGAVWVQLSNRITEHIDIGFGYIGKQSWNQCGAPACQWSVDEQIYFGFELVVADPWWQRMRIGFGPYYFQNADRIVTSNLRICPSFEVAGWGSWSRVGFKARHCSSAGSSPEIEACNDFGQCFTNDWNTGQDSWARVVWYFGD